MENDKKSGCNNRRTVENKKKKRKRNMESKPTNDESIHFVFYLYMYVYMMHNSILLIMDDYCLEFTIAIHCK